MRSGKWRGVTLALGLVCALGVSSAAQAQFHTIPRLVPAQDLNTGGPYYAPPVPYGHYAGKNLTGKVGGKIGGLLHGGGHGGGLGLGNGCSTCGGLGHGLGLGHGGGGGVGGCGDGLCDGGCGLGHGGLLHKKSCGAGCGHVATVVATPQQVAAPIPVMPSAQCVDPGCKLFGKHKHMGCGSCGGKGCGSCGISDPCGSCGGKGCGRCGLGNGLCNNCGGLGCGLCSKAKGLVNHLLGRDKIKWFNGPGGPVPLTPGYTPYVVTTRSPRDFLSFPPFTP